MSNYENIPAITFIDGDLTKKWDRVILTGEVFRAKVHPKALKSEDKSYAISVKLDKESFMKLKKLKLDSTDKGGNITSKGDRPLTGLKKVDLKVKDEEGNEVLDEMDEPIKEFSHYQISVYQRKQINGKDFVLPVVMAEDNSAVDTFLNEGTKVSVLGQAYETIFRDKPAMGLNLKEVKVHELVAYEGGSSSSNYGADPWAALGMTAAPSFEPEVAEEVEEKVEETKQQPAPDFDDFEDTVPF